MIQPIRMASSTKAMKAPISGQNMAVNIYEGTGRGAAGAMRSEVQGGLFAGRGKRPRDLKATLLAEHEAHLPGGTQPVRVGRTEGAAGSGVSHGA